MPKIDINQVAEILKRHRLDAPTLRGVVEELNNFARANGADEERPPTTKKQHVIIVSDPEGRFPNADFAGWVVQIPDNDSPATAIDRLHRAAYEYNATKKGRLLPVRALGEAIEVVPAKIFKEAEVWVKTKTPVLVVTSDNQIPRDVSQVALGDDEDFDPEGES